jgi:hypothetical protein
MADATLQSAATLTPTLNNSVYGSLINLPTGAAIVIVPKAGANTAQLTATAVAGDYVDMNSDGVFWYVNGISSVAGGLA